MPEITKIVITGGPCAGKTTAMSWIQNAFTSMGYTVLFVPETATEFIGGGVAPWTCGSNRDYQLVQVSLQITKEKLFEQAATTMPADKILIVCDRGVLDNKAYMTSEDFAFVMNALKVNEVELRDGYDAVFHLVTAAKGAEEFYTTANNQARIETVSQACEMDDRLLASWTLPRPARADGPAAQVPDRLSGRAAPRAAAQLPQGGDHPDLSAFRGRHGAQGEPARPGRAFYLLRDRSDGRRPQGDRGGAPPDAEPVPDSPDGGGHLPEADPQDKVLPDVEKPVF